MPYSIPNSPNEKCATIIVSMIGKEREVKSLTNRCLLQHFQEFFTRNAHPLYMSVGLGDIQASNLLHNYYTCSYTPFCIYIQEKLCCEFLYVFMLCMDGLHG